MQSDSPHSHSRTNSKSLRQSLPRRSTKGPLDEDDPLAQPEPATPQTAGDESTQRPQPEDSPLARVVEREQKDFAVLLRPDIFHPINNSDIPEPFRRPPTEEQSSASLEDLIASGLFRFAAERSVQLLKVTKSTDFQRIFYLYYARLVCLQLLGLHNQAAQEVRALQDFQGTFYRDIATGQHLAPWELRVLVIRLQAIGFGDFRRGIMSYYDLARECRFRLRKGQGEDHDLWSWRLRDLGIRVANALVETGDVDNAIEQLQQQTQDNSLADDLSTRAALVCLRTGRIESARSLIGDASEGKSTALLFAPLLSMADGHFDQAVSQWKDAGTHMDAGSPLETVVLQNLAVCLVYAARVQEARSVLKALINNGSLKHSITFNLSTVFELSSEHAKDLKSGLAEQAAKQASSSIGWERSQADFKL